MPAPKRLMLWPRTQSMLLFAPTRSSGRCAMTPAACYSVHFLERIGASRQRP
jgi:hypothetical protein